MTNLTFISGYWLASAENNWWQWKNSFREYNQSVNRFLDSLQNVDKQIQCVFLYNSNTKCLIDADRWGHVEFLDITGLYDWNRPINHWVKFALITQLWKRFGRYIWFDVDCEFTNVVHISDLVWVDNISPPVAFFSINPVVDDPLRQFGDNIQLTRETHRERLQEMYGVPEKGIITSAIYLINDSRYADACQTINQEVDRAGYTPYNDEWGHLAALQKQKIDFQNNTIISLRTLWPQCLGFHHDVARFYGPGTY